MINLLSWLARRTPWVVLILFWEAGGRALSFPTFSHTLALIIQNLSNHQFLTALAGSLKRMLIGYLGVCLVGIAFGLLLGRFRWLDGLLGTLVAAVNAMPGAAWVPLAILLFGLNEAAVIFTILLGATGIVLVNTSFGVRDVPPLILRAAQTMGARGMNLFWHVIVPSAIPRIVDGLRLAWAFGWRALMAGELLVSSVRGIGQLLNQVARERNVDQLLALMGIIAMIGMLVDGVFFNRFLGNKVKVRWGTT